MLGLQRMNEFLCRYKPCPEQRAVRPAGQRPTALKGGRFGDVILRAQRRSVLHDKVQTTNAVMPTRGPALPGSADLNFQIVPFQTRNMHA